MKITWDFKELEDFGNNLVNGSFQTHMKTVTKKIAEELLDTMKLLTPKDTGALVSGWDGNDLLVVPATNGYEVLIINENPYALFVNDGHRVKNQKEGPYLKVKHRVKVPIAHQWQKPVNDWYVFGHFFVERGILEVESSTEMEKILKNELLKWWRML